MLSTLLDARTLAHLWDAPGPAVQRTIEAGGWGGCLWPGHEEWADMATMSPDDIRAGSQLLSLGLHSFTTHHPEADVLLLCIAAVEDRVCSTSSQRLACTLGVRVDDLLDITSLPMTKTRTCS